MVNKFQYILGMYREFGEVLGFVLNIFDFVNRGFYFFLCSSINICVFILKYNNNNLFKIFFILYLVYSLEIDFIGIG